MCAWSLRSHFGTQAPPRKLRLKAALEEIKTMDFEIKSDNEYRILFSERSHDSKGWLTQYTVTLYSPNMSGTVRVDNSPYGESPLQLFQSIENEWKGWKGEKSWWSFEGEFDLSATSDSTGHITLKASLFSGYGVPSSRLQTELQVESGQLDQIAKTAREFFEC